MVHICVLAGSLLAAVVPAAGEMAPLTPFCVCSPSLAPFPSAQEGVLDEGSCLQLLPVIISLCL